jgi:hypothetical protein
MFYATELPVNVCFCFIYTTGEQGRKPVSIDYFGSASPDIARSFSTSVPIRSVQSARRKSGERQESDNGR